MWVQLRSAKHIDQNGRTQTFFPGDWVEVGKQTALRWIADGEARVSVAESIPVPEGCGAGVLRKLDQENADPFTGIVMPWKSVDTPGLYYERTLLWDALVPLRLELLGTGFALLERWDVAIPLLDYSTLAADLGTPEEREALTRIAHDLRVLVYDPRIVFIRRSEASSRFIDAWNELSGGDERLNVLQALYVTRPTILALPPSWRRQRERQ